MFHSINTAHYNFSPPLGKTKKLLKIAAAPPTSLKNFTWKHHQLKHNKRIGSIQILMKKIDKYETYY